MAVHFAACLVSLDCCLDASKPGDKASATTMCTFGDQENTDSVNGKSISYRPASSRAASGVKGASANQSSKPVAAVGYNHLALDSILVSDTKRDFGGEGLPLLSSYQPLKLIGHE